MESDRVIPGDILDDLCSRFIINVPEHERKDLIRILFQIESAHWFYLDFYSKNFPGRKACGLREFTKQVFRHISFLQPFINSVDEIIEIWKDYKFCVPTFGGILLDEELTHVLLVQSYRSSWGFPKGKVNKDEHPCQCAIREVYEETGFDITHLIDQNSYVEANINEQIIRLYIIPGVRKDEKFVPKTRNEIKAISWFPLCDIPLRRKDAKQWKIGYGFNNATYNSFYMVSPFLRKIRQWIYEHSNRMPSQRRRPRNKSCSEIDFMHTSSPMDSDKKVWWKKLEKFGRDEAPGLKTKLKPNTSEGISRPVMEECDYNCESLCLRTQSQLTIDNKRYSNVNHSAVKKSYSSSVINPLTEHTAALQTYKLPMQNFIPIEQTLPRDPTDFIKTIAMYSSAYTKTFKATDFNSDPDNTLINRNSSATPLFASQIEQTSEFSAFKKFDKHNKQGRRKRGKRNKSQKYEDKSNETRDLRKNTKINLHQISPPVVDNSVNQYMPIENISAWAGFRFNLNSILRSMNDAVNHKHAKN